MRYRCSICGRETDESTETTRHISREHGRANFGWHMERIAEAPFERVGVWVANLPVRVRYRCFERRESLTRTTPTGDHQLER